MGTPLEDLSDLIRNLHRTRYIHGISVCLTAKSCSGASKCGTNESSRDIRDDCLFSTYCIPGVVRGVKWKVMKLIKKCSRVFGFLFFSFFSHLRST